MAATTEIYYKKEFWAKENLNYSAPHFRLEKAARLINRLAGTEEQELLDLGCGPAALMPLLHSNINYYGIDIAIAKPAPNLFEMDFVDSPITCGGRQFDIVIAQGVFEYVGSTQEAKFSEIRELLKPNGTFIVTYVNFDHCHQRIYWPYNNIRAFDEFRDSLSRFFTIQRYFPTSHRWTHDEPRDRISWLLHKYVNVNVPVLSRMFGVEYFFICGNK